MCSARNNSERAGRSGSRAVAARDARSQRRAPSVGPLRELVESVAIALVFAFVFRAFAAEAFVIPTGSMAPTLRGWHKDVTCRNCGFRYAAKAPNGSEDDSASGRGEDGESRRQRLEQIAAAQEVIGTTCPLCRYTMSLTPSTDFPSYNGDRIIVAKVLYDFEPPSRWDVVVFRYPDSAKQNYIKRLVGLPGESVQIYHGDIYTRGGEEGSYTIARKPPNKVRAMAQMVYDNDYVVDEMSQKGWPVRWQSSDGSWTTKDGSRSYQTDGSGEQESWLRYRHFVPTQEDWKLLDKGPLPSGYRAKPQLITDFYAYNTSIPRGQPMMQPQTVGLHWVGDLLLECQVEVQSDGGKVLLDLVKGGRHFRATLDVSSGQAELSIVGLPSYHPVAQTSLRGRGTYHVAFANVDQQLLLWINGSVVSFDTPTTYEALDNDRPVSTEQDAGDLAPAGVGSQGAALRVSHQSLKRDIYYIADRLGMGSTRQLSDYHDPSCPLVFMNDARLAEFFSNPDEWSPRNGRQSPFDFREAVTFDMGQDQFFVLGDNSPASSDARLWRDEQYVDRDLLIGKALCIYWPHSLYVTIPLTDIEIPFVPNLHRMRLIH